MKTLKRSLASITVFVSILLVSVHAFADDDILGHAIPANMCAPHGASAESKLRLTPLGWEFRPQETGTAWLYCPLPFTTFANSEGGPGKAFSDILEYRVYYRDTDGTEVNSTVMVFVFDRSSSGRFTLSGRWTSNGNTETNHTLDTKSINKNLNADTLHGFLIWMTRSNSSQSPIFGGIDFPQNFLI
jgi:hypothetical protein